MTAISCAITRRHHSKKFLLTIVAIVSFSAGCKNSATGEPTPTPVSEVRSRSTMTLFEKFLGTWQTRGGKSFEQWSKNGDGTYASRVFSLAGSDTNWKEEARIFPEDNAWIFQNVVKGENDGKEVRFTSSIINDTSVLFSNPAHDFPTDIQYTLLNDSTLQAFITGPGSKGGRDTVWFDYRLVELRH